MLPHPKSTSLSSTAPHSCSSQAGDFKDHVWSTTSHGPNFDESRKDGGAGMIEFTMLTATTTFGKLDVMQVQHAHELWYKRLDMCASSYTMGSGSAVSP
jgi:hypothetical protein